MNKSVYRVAIIGAGRMGGLIEDELSVNQSEFGVPNSIALCRRRGKR